MQQRQPPRYRTGTGSTKPKRTQPLHRWLQRAAGASPRRRRRRAPTGPHPRQQGAPQRVAALSGRPRQRAGLRAFSNPKQNGGHSPGMVALACGAGQGAACRPPGLEGPSSGQRTHTRGQRGAPEPWRSRGLATNRRAHTRVGNNHHQINRRAHLHLLGCFLLVKNLRWSS